MSKLNEILALIRHINEDEFREPLTKGESLDDLHEELLFLIKKNESRKRRTDLIIEQIANSYAGDFFSKLPISEEEDELDVFCMGFNTYVEELKTVMVSKKILEKKNKRLQEEKNRSEQLAKAKDEFMSSMSHEIRTPLNGILGFTDILLKNTAIDEESQKQLNYIKMLGDTLHVIINDILDLAKIESGQISLSNKPFNLPILTQLIYDTFALKTTEKDIDFSLSMDKNIPSDFIGDSTRISQILYNLVSNAVKFTPEKGKIDLKIDLDKSQKENHLIRMTVQDTGVGIPTDRLDHVFDPFIQVSDDTARQYGGTGLGLSIVKKIISKMKGTISVESLLGTGSTFIVTIPLQKAVVESPVSEPISKKEIDSAVEFIDKKIKVLLAEDNKINQLLVQKVLSGFKLDCVIVENGKLAVEAVKNNDFDVVLMDLMMPEMDGFEATEAIRHLDDSNKKNIPIIALTAAVTDSVTDKCAAVGMDKYLSKPFKGDQLYKMIIDSINEKQFRA